MSKDRQHYKPRITERRHPSFYTMAQAPRADRGSSHWSLTRARPQGEGTNAPRCLVQCRGTSHADPIPTHPQACLLFFFQKIFWRCGTRDRIVALSFCFCFCFSFSFSLLASASESCTCCGGAAWSNEKCTGLQQKFPLLPFCLPAKVSASASASSSASVSSASSASASSVSQLHEAPTAAWFSAGGLLTQTRSPHIPRLASARLAYHSFRLPLILF